jgi:hypothetical protein
MDLAGLLLRQLAGHRTFRRAFLRDVPLCVAGCLSFRPDSAYLRLRYPSVAHIYYFKYVRWDVARILETLVSEASWQPRSGASGWHSDCKFHPLKEYMFQRMLGATYADAFISNQVRHNLMTRAEAWEEMVGSKHSLSEDLARVVHELDMQHLRSRIDPNCFAVTS